MRIGIDLGGTKIAGCALSEDGKEILRRRVATPKGDYAATVAAISSLVLSIEKDVAASCTVGIPEVSHRKTARTETQIRRV